MGDRSRFFVRLLKSRWLVVVAAIWIQCSSGATYSFGIYSQTVKDTFSYDQKSLDTLATWKDLGANIGIVSGLAFDWLSARKVLAIGAVENSFAYLAIWLSVTGRIATPEFWQMCLYMFLAANAQSFFSTACVVTCVQNFPRNRGVIIGLMKGLLGLSGAILTQIYHAIYGNQPSSYLLMAVWLPSVIPLFLMVIVRPVPARKEHLENRSLTVLSTIAISLAAFLMGGILLDRMISISHSGYVAVCVIMCGMLLLPLGVVVKSELQEEASTSLSTLKEPLVGKNKGDPASLPGSVAVPADGDVEGGGCVRGSERTRSLTDAEAGTGSSGSSTDYKRLSSIEKGYPVNEQPAEKGPYRGEEHTVVEVGGCVRGSERTRSLTDVEAGTGSSRSSTDYKHLSSIEKGYPINEQPAENGPHRGEEHTIVEAVVKVDFWLLFLAMACGMSSGLTAIDNTGQIGASLGYSSEQVGTFISLFSVWNFLGRLGFGVLSEFCLHKYNIGRPVLLASSQVLMSGGYLMISSALPNSLYPALVIIGLCYGAQWSLMPAITSELFGLSRFATLFNTISVASPLGAYFFSVQILGRLYDTEALKDNNKLDLEDLDCYGAHCFRLTFIILAAVTLVGGAVCMVLVYRTKSFYSRFLQKSLAR